MRARLSVLLFKHSLYVLLGFYFTRNAISSFSFIVLFLNQTVPLGLTASVVLSGAAQLAWVLSRRVGNWTEPVINVTQGTRANTVIRVGIQLAN